ncbi:hypothetical protein D3C83_332390 [compost metagenome]
MRGNEGAATLLPQEYLLRDELVDRLANGANRNIELPGELRFARNGGARLP